MAVLPHQGRYFEDDQSLLSSIEKTMIRYGSLVRDLTLESKQHLDSQSRGPLLDFLASNIHHLERLSVALDIDYFRDHSVNDCWIQVRKVFLSNPDIKHLELKNRQQTDDTKYLTLIFATTPPFLTRLTTLRLFQMRFNLHTLVHLSSQCQQLSQLSVRFCQLERYLREEYPREVFAETKPPLFPKLESLELVANKGLGTRIILDWVAHCPQVKTVELEDKYFSSSTMYNWSLFKNCKQLRRLSIVLVNTFGDKELSEVLRICKEGALTDLRLQIPYCEYNMFKTLSGPHARNLVLLDLFSTFYENSSAFGLILGSCSRLKSFAFGEYAIGGHVWRMEDVVKANQQEAEDKEEASKEIQERRRWACSGLKRLKIRELTWSLCHDLNRGFVQELTALTQLQELSVGQIHSAIQKSALKLKAGEYGKVQMYLDPELQWMTQTWPKLRWYSADRPLSDDF
ncbi:hypothetical protein BGZ83_001423 [Gryganskiella cystojenkinii]|nr:hypothetical protein BGZ83_001423 [Gryganskiella cystojenkinii]